MVEKEQEIHRLVAILHIDDFHDAIVIAPNQSVKNKNCMHGFDTDFLVLV